MLTIPPLEHLTISAPSTDLEILMDKFSRGPNKRIDGYELGEDLLLTRDGGKTNQSKMKDIDWEKMHQEAHKLAIEDANEWGEHGAGRDQLISLREKVRSRPSSFLNRDGVWCQEDSMDEDMDKSLNLYQATWEEALKNAQPDDTITHWHISL
ncbi:MAG: hypothetical protein UY10_C0038G0002 [Microgenomates group bacterium GW2011_GWA2_47_8]|nr:MAG: hypothetical protein UY10_C0038G0002 [Microgenomates group bacterium GW2011_GWA2_47_8]